MVVGKLLWKRHVDQLRYLAGSSVPDEDDVQVENTRDQEVSPFPNPVPEVSPLCQ